MMNGNHNFLRQLTFCLPTVSNDNLSNYSLTDLNYKSPCVIISNRIATQMIVIGAIICIRFLFTELHSQPDGYRTREIQHPGGASTPPTMGKTAVKFLWV